MQERVGSSVWKDLEIANKNTFWLEDDSNVLEDPKIEDDFPLDLRAFLHFSWEDWKIYCSLVDMQ